MIISCRWKRWVSVMLFWVWLWLGMWTTRFDRLLASSQPLKKNVDVVDDGISTSSCLETNSQPQNTLRIHVMTSLLLTPSVVSPSRCNCKELSTTLRMFRSLLRAAYPNTHRYQMLLSFQLNLFHSPNVVVATGWEDCEEVRKLEVDIVLLALPKSSSIAAELLLPEVSSAELLPEVLRRHSFTSPSSTEAFPASPVDWILYLDSNLMLFPGFLSFLYEELLEPLPANTTVGMSGDEEDMLKHTVDQYRQSAGSFRLHPKLQRMDAIIFTTMSGEYLCEDRIFWMNTKGYQAMQALFHNTTTSLVIHNLVNQRTTIPDVGELTVQSLPVELCTFSHHIIERAYHAQHFPTLYFFSILESKQTLFFTFNATLGERCHASVDPGIASINLNEINRNYVIIALDLLIRNIQKNHNFCLELSSTMLTRLLVTSQDISLVPRTKKTMVSQSANKKVSTKAWYVYDLPGKFIDPIPYGHAGFVPLDHYQHKLDAFLVERAEKLHNAGGGRWLGNNNQTASDTSHLYHTVMHSLFAHFYHRFVSLSFVEKLPLLDERGFRDDAWYLIPYDIASDTPFGDEARFLPGCPLALELIEMLEQSPTWQQSEGGKRHILVISTLYSNTITHATCLHFVLEFCEQCIKLTIEDCQQPRDVALLSPSTSSREKPSSLHFPLQNFLERHFHFLTIPYPSSLHFPLSWKVADVAQYHQHSNRNTLVTFVGSDWRSNDVIYRPFLRQVCEQEYVNTIHSRRACHWIDLANELTSTDEHTKVSRLLHAHYHQSIFCLMPRAPTFSRKAVIDAIQCGCIPVIFHLETFHFLHPLHLTFQEATNSSVFYPGNQLVDISSTEAFFSFLYRISDTSIRQKQAALRSVAKRLQYSLPLQDYTNLTIDDIKDNQLVEEDAFLRTLRMFM